MSGKAKEELVIAGAGRGTPDALSELIAATRRQPPKTEFGGPVLERRSISEQVANRILSMIKSGNLKSGDRLPTEAQLGIAFGISRPPLREALKALTLMGVLESRQGGRYTVTDLSPSRLVAPFNVMLSIGDYDVHEHFEARAVVDLELVRLATLRATPEQRQRILKHAVDGRAFHHDPVAFRLIDIEFHQSLNDAARNRLLSALAQGLYDVGLDARRVASAVPGVIEKSVAQHIVVAEAVMAGDVEAAVEGYRRHLEHVRDTTIQSMATDRPVS
ncbi:MAG: FadR family transcriptional regulator [Devosia nanyangense]|uniref:FadR family transcriptional regulator n=1 Tax=Devosia nanyangense TaxID=1228055 RepID=A0A933P0W4_9HYPH|nr:FadR family transcriptional regulator [Devosia nanyangense]